ncbi:unnamed protein product [Cuscuta epithymum]|uniref:Uncharacterized protein n=1 Tax=Cuscuta epithymum TaxID=186058 RepID=A0AAV0FBH9_9ASTE|nr:unnamed protein product [Cuscuta epithymum]
MPYKVTAPKPDEVALKTKPVIKFPKNGNVRFDDLGGRVITNVHELKRGEVITQIDYDENKRKNVYGMMPNDVPRHHKISRVGDDLQRVGLESQWISFTYECISEIPGVTANSRTQWYDFKDNIFYNYMASFFDVTTRDNKKYAIEKARRRKAQEGKDAKGKRTDVANKEDGDKSIFRHAFDACSGRILMVFLALRRCKSQF